MLSTTGPVTFVSENAQMLGTGLELIYNEELQRLEFFRIIHLESLRFKGSQAALFSRTTGDSNTPTQSIIASDAQKSKEIQTAGRVGVEKRQGEYYKCVLSKNVVIDSPEQLVFAEDKVAINNIFWPKASDGQSGKAETAGTDDVAARKVVVPKHSEPAKSHEETGDIVVSCDNGVVLIPMDSAKEQNNSDTLSVEAALSDKKHPKSSVDIARRPTFVTRRIDYDISTGDAIAPGLSELTFYTGPIADAKSEEVTIPVKITAQKETKFLSASNQVIFEGDCVCIMSRTEPNNVQQEYTLTAPKLTTNLKSRATSQGSSLEHLTADGGVVKLMSRKKMNGQSLGGADLECHRLDYDTDQEMFEATGPGEIVLDNSKISEPNEQVGRFSFRRPCYAFLRDFATLKYFQKDNRIIADAQPGGTLRMDYFPVVEGKYGQQVVATATHADISLVQAADGQTELSALTASGAVTYKNEDEDIEFLGSKLFFDHEKSIMKVWGDESAPCYYNGALVDEIEYDLKTGKVKARIPSPGVMQLR